MRYYLTFLLLFFLFSCGEAPSGWDGALVSENGIVSDNGGNGDNGDDGNDGNDTETEITGCTDPEADNYDSLAVSDNGSCIYLGCTDETAPNYDPNATDDDGSCGQYGCTDSGAQNYDPNATDDDGSCQYLTTYSWGIKIFDGNNEAGDWYVDMLVDIITAHPNDSVTTGAYSFESTDYETSISSIDDIFCNDKYGNINGDSYESWFSGLTCTYSSSGTEYTNWTYHTISLDDANLNEDGNVYGLGSFTFRLHVERSDDSIVCSENVETVVPFEWTVINDPSYYPGTLSITLDPDWGGNTYNVSTTTPSITTSCY